MGEAQQFFTSVFRCGTGQEGDRGPPGPPGPQGETGAPGATGPEGDAVVADPPCFDNNDRFVDCGNGSVTDQNTGLVWLKNADCLRGLNWEQSNGLAVALEDGDCGLSDNSSPGNWHLPTQEQFQSIFDSSCPSPSLPNTPGTGCASTGPNLFNFPAITARSFFTSTIDSTDATKQIMANLDNGSTFSFNRDNSAGTFSFWAVRDC